MRSLIKLEELFLFLLSIFLFAQLGMPWWWYAAFFLAPDLGILGYLVGLRVGAVSYNVLHHKSVAVSAFVYLKVWGWELSEIMSSGPRRRWRLWPAR